MMYDTIVIGNDLSSLVAATIISHRGGKAVLLSECDNQYVYSESGYTFHIDPTPITGFGPKQICSRLFEDLGISLTKSNRLHLLDPGLQIILPNNRIDCFYDKEALLTDMAREFTSHTGEIREFYTSVLRISDLVEQWIAENPYLYPKNYKELVWLLKNIPVFIKQIILFSQNFEMIKKDHSLDKVLEAQIAYFSNFYTNTRHHFNILTAYILSLPLRGLYCHVEGRNLLMNLLKSKFTDSGGLLINNCSVDKISIKNEITIDVDTHDKLSSFSGKYLITSTKWEKLGSLLLNDRKMRSLKRRLKSVEAIYYPFTIHMGVHEKCIPEKMTSYVAILGNEDCFSINNNIVFLESSASGQIERAPSGKRALSATVFLKESPQILNDDELNDIYSSIFQSLETFLPFLKENLDYINVDKSIELSRKNQELVNKKYSLQPSRFFGMANISNKTPKRNVYITGDMLLSGLGFEGEIMSGMNAANFIIREEYKNE